MVLGRQAIVHAWWLNNGPMNGGHVEKGDVGCESNDRERKTKSHRPISDILDWFIL